MKINSTQEIRFVNVTIFELDAVVSLYKKSTYQTQKDVKLTTTFGLPLTTVIINGKISGFASVVLDTVGKHGIQCFFYNQNVTKEIETKLKSKAAESFQKTFNIESKIATDLQTSIERLVYWLNL